MSTDDRRLSEEEIIRAALALPPTARGELARKLVRSMEEDTQSTIDAAWADEIDRRIDAIERGEVELIPAEEVFASMQGLFEKRTSRQWRPKNQGI